MRKFVALVMSGVLLFPAASLLIADDKEEKEKEVPAVLDFEMKTLKGEDVKLSQYHGKVVLFVNVASQCGLTPQYEALQELHKKYAEKGLAIIGVPSNDFGAQEPGSDEEIGEFCKENYGVEFDMLSKVVVKGEGQCDLYKFLTSEETNPEFCGDITWNFEKFLVSREGKVVSRFAPKVKPDSDDVIEAIEKELEKEFETEE